MNLHLLRIGKRPQKHPDGHFNHSNWTVSILKFTFKSKKQTTLSFVKTLRLYFDRKCFASCNFSFFKQHTKKQRKHPPEVFSKKLAPRKMVGWDWKMIQSLLVGWLTNHHHHHHRHHHHHHRLPTTGVEALFLGQLHWCFDLFGRLGLGLTRRGFGRRCVLRSFILTWVPARGLTDVMR